jgi:hypothetical protein
MEHPAFTFGRQRLESLQRGAPPGAVTPRPPAPQPFDWTPLVTGVVAVVGVMVAGALAGPTRGELVWNARWTTYRPRCGCGPWIDHHRWHSDDASGHDTCLAFGCAKASMVGAHVIRRSAGASRAEYIVPLCHGHNARPGEFVLKAHAVLVPANTSVTGCYRPFIT